VPEVLNQKVDLLVTEVHGLRESVQQVRDELAEANERAERAEATAQRTRSWLWILGVVLSAVVLTGALAFVGAYYLIDRNNQKFCALLSISAQADPPPTTERGREARRAAVELSRAFRCGS
jgi:cytochrome c-type biogenesis protein CcmH/NrfG